MSLKEVSNETGMEMLKGRGGEKRQRTTSSPSFHDFPNQCDIKKRKLQIKKRITNFYDLYKLTTETLGEGSCATVRTCINIKTNQEYAVKLLLKSQNRSSKVKREILMFRQCQTHANITHLVNVFEDTEYFYLVFEKVKGGELHKRIVDKGAVDEATVAEIVTQLASALQFMHKRGMAHRDLKPQNILCVNVDSLSPVKICDFDLGSIIPLESNSQPSSSPEQSIPVGTIEYMAPEIVKHYDDLTLTYDGRHCDLWALGVITYQMLCGHFPFLGKCGEPQCRWDDGEECDKCQQLVFQSILENQVDFSTLQWKNISSEAKNLVSSLLLDDASERISADQVLEHQWLKNCASGSFCRQQ